MIGIANADMVREVRCAKLTAAVALLLCLPLSLAAAPHQSHAPAPHAQPTRGQASRPAQQQRPQSQPRPQYEPNHAAQAPQNPQYSTVPQNTFRQAPVNPSTGVQPAFPNTTYKGQGYTRPNYPGNAQPPAYTPPGHLGAWLNEHRDAAPQVRQRMLQNDPSFNHLSQADQQRLVRQLNRVDQMPEAQRQRRLARAENLERLSPQERAQVRDSARQWTTLPADRQALMKGAFQDLRSVPPDQRQTVLDSARYQNAFSPEEHSILTKMLSVEPYEPPK